MQQTTTPPHDDIDESAQRRAFSRAVEVLSSSLDFGLTLEHTIAVCLPALGDHGFFDVVHGDEVRRTARRRQRRRRADACAAAARDGLRRARGRRCARRAGRFRGLRLVALTGYGREHDRSAALAAGFDEHLVKPVHPEALMAVIERLLQERRP